eukprot:5908879-Prymnesium_polylepis.1
MVREAASRPLPLAVLIGIGLELDPHERSSTRSAVITHDSYRRQTLRSISLLGSRRSCISAIFATKLWNSAKVAAHRFSKT